MTESVSGDDEARPTTRVVALCQSCSRVRALAGMTAIPIQAGEGLFMGNVQERTFCQDCLHSIRKREDDSALRDLAREIRSLRDFMMEAIGAVPGGESAEKAAERCVAAGMRRE